MSSSDTSSRHQIEIFSHVDDSSIPIDWLEERAREALPACLASPGSEEPVLPSLETIEISLVSDETIADVHGEFLDDPTPTDVITFHHGEILISADTAKREGPAHGNEWHEEILLYLIHGLLHLNGHTDLVEPDRKRMHRRQEEILQEVLTNP